MRDTGALSPSEMHANAKCTQFLSHAVSCRRVARLPLPSPLTGPQIMEGKQRNTFTPEPQGAILCCTMGVPSLFRKRVKKISSLLQYEAQQEDRK